MGSRISEAPPKLRRHHMLDTVNTKTFTPREYQVELLDAARKKNTIVCLGTGTGKTFIAVMVVKELAHQIRSSFDHGGKRTILLVPTVPLVHQQMKIIEDYTDLRVGKYFGTDEISLWTKEIWINEFKRNHVLVLTADIFRMVLHHGFLPLSKINLLIFDECHRAVKSHPYCDIMQCFDVCSEENQPRILGLSASLVNGKCKPSKLEQEIRNLEKVLKSSVETASDLTVLSKYGTKPQEFLVLYKPYTSDSLNFIKILTHLNSALVFLDDMNINWQADEEMLPHPCRQPRRYLMEISHVIMTLGPWCTQQAIELFFKEINYMLDVIYSEQHKRLLLLVQTVLQVIAALCENMLRGKDTLSKLVDYAPDKLTELLKVLEKYKPEEPKPDQKEEDGENKNIRASECSDVEKNVNEGKGNDEKNVNPEKGNDEKNVNQEKDNDEKNVNQEKGNDEKNVNQEKGDEKNVNQEKGDEKNVNQEKGNDEKNVNQGKGDEKNVNQEKSNEQNHYTIETQLKEFKCNGEGLESKTVQGKIENIENHEQEKKTDTYDVKERRRGFSNYHQSLEDSKLLCGIIFVKQRITAYILNQWLSELSKHHPDFNFIVPNFIVGHGKSGSGAAKDVAMAFRKQEEILQKFRTREYNLVVATSVVEEGMDIPKCNLVVRFDIPQDFRAYIQSKGRARAPDSLYVLMVRTDEKDRFVEDLCDFKTIEEILLEKCHKKDSTIEEIPDSDADKLMEPYMPVRMDGSPRVTLSSAIALVNRYCAKLPSDTFTRLTPKWKLTEISTASSNPQFQCVIRLPINSPLKKPIMGNIMPNKQLSKMAAALKTCEELHKAGELDDNLLPTGKEAVKFEEEVIEEFHDEQTPQGTARPGTTKRRQYYFKQIADALKGSHPKSDSSCFLYTFNMKLTCPIPEEQNTRGRKIHDPADTLRGFGIVTNKPIPPICSFPVFTRSGEVTVYLEYISSDMHLTEEQLEQLSYFHKYTFADVLRLEKYPMLYNQDESESSFFIVPFNKCEELEDYSIDWRFVSVINEQKGVSPRKLSEDERKNFSFIVENYLDAVVMPWYRNLDKPQFFYVAEICNNLNPKSDFPDAGYETFEGYYREKYNIAIMNSNQPLLDVDHTSARLNLLTPRYVNRKGVTLPTSSEQTKKAKRENLQQKQILIPELCIIHPFPASLWRKAVCLPCILYRVNSLLLAEQLRLTVAQSISVGMAELPKDFQWPMLDFGWTLADVLKAQAAIKDDESQKQEVSNAMHVNQLQRKEEIINNEYNVSKCTPTSLGSLPNNDTINNATGDFVIDTFDPSKVDIPDDDFLIEQELNQINFGSGGFIGGPPTGYPLWKPISNPNETSSSPELPMIRYGSPSNFEGTGWDSEWDTEVGDTFFSLNLPGLGYISAPGVFNMEGLSMDLASCRDDDLWDSMDEDSLYDEMEFERMPQFIKELTPSEAAIEFLQSSNKVVTKELCESEWLSTCSVPNSEFPELLNCLDPLDESIENQVSQRRDVKKKEIRFLSTENETVDENEEEETTESGLKFAKISSAIKQIEEYCEKSGITNDFKDLIFTTSELAQVGDDVNALDINNLLDILPEKEESTLAFGELLPNREEIHICDKDIFRVHFDDSPDLCQHPGPSPSIVLQAFTMSNANDGINLERLETVGDSFLKYAITAYLFCTYPDIHEGKLSYLRSKQISNLNLYRLGKKKRLGELMVATKFEPNDNWLPPNYTVPKGLEQALIESGLPAGHWNIGNLSDLTQMSEEQIRQSVMEKKQASKELDYIAIQQSVDNPVPYIPYNLLTQHSIPDKSVADCVEALIGAYLVSCGSRGALLFMSWLGLRVLPNLNKDKKDIKPAYGYLEPPPSPLLTHVPNAGQKLERLLSGYAAFEQKIGYFFRDKAYLLQAFTHASYHYNTLTDCYQRLEFLGDAVLDYLITRHLYEDPQKHSPGTLTDLRSALVNNTFFASLAVKYDFHKYFKAISPGLFNVINKFVEMKKNDSGFEDYEQAYYLEEEECEEAEEVEVPKALGDIFESVAGAVYLDSDMSLDTVWRVYYAMMKPEIEYFSTHVPKSPIRELLEMEPQTAKFERAEMTLSGKVRVRVEVFGKGQFVGVGRNKRIAKCTAAKRALRELKKMKKEKESSRRK